MIKFRIKIFKGLSGNFYISDITKNKEEVLKFKIFEGIGDCLNDFFEEEELKKLRHSTALEMEADVTYDAEEYDTEGSRSDHVNIMISSVLFA